MQEIFFLVYLGQSPWVNAESKHFQSFDTSVRCSENDGAKVAKRETYKEKEIVSMAEKRASKRERACVETFIEIKHLKEAWRTTEERVAWEKS